MKRRDFLKAAIVTAGSVLVGCGDDDDKKTPADTGSDATADGGDTAVSPDMIPDGMDATDTTDVVTPPHTSPYFPQSVLSGDPKADSVILWTRIEDANASGDVDVMLEVALDEQFTQIVQLDGAASMTVTAEAAFDRCVKVRLTGLDAATYYWYRFSYDNGTETIASNVGRTKTAPMPTDSVPVRFAFVSCQDFNGKYYNTYKRLVKEDVDFFIHLGDYVYETTGDPAFQETTPDRVVTFGDTAGAIAFNVGTEKEYYAAKSLDNYRDLYRTYRSDAALQKMHESAPMIAVWDDHEYSDDCFGANASYTDGREDELDVTRRKSANKAWFEYMPVDFMDAPDFRYDENATYPDDIRIYRDFSFGANMHLVMTDLRTYRPDHLIPEDLFPGTVLMTQAELETAVGSLPAWADPYVDIATHGGGLYAGILTAAAADVGYDAADVTGNVSVTYINGIVENVNEATGSTHALIDPAGLERGLTGVALGKASPFSQLGTRYLLRGDAFDVWSAKRYADTAGASEDIMGTAQETWFLDTMSNATATWKVWGNEYSLVQRAVDLSGAPSLPDMFKARFYLSAEDWDGAPNKRDELLAALSTVDNVVAVTGDIHAFFAGTPMVKGSPAERIVEFVGSSISSGTYQSMLMKQAGSDPVLAAAGAPAIAFAVQDLLVDPTLKPNPPLAYANIRENGFVVVDLDASLCSATYFKIGEGHVKSDLGPDELDDKFTLQRFRVAAGSSKLEGEFDGTWQTFDSTTSEWS